MEVIHMRLKERIKYWKDIKNGTSIPLFWCNINLNKFRVKKEGSCDVSFHPVVFDSLEQKQKDIIIYHMNQIVDMVRNNIEDLEELK